MKPYFFYKISNNQATFYHFFLKDQAPFYLYNLIPTLNNPCRTRNAGDLNGISQAQISKSPQASISSNRNSSALYDEESIVSLNAKILEEVKFILG